LLSYVGKLCPCAGQLVLQREGQQRHAAEESEQ